MAERVSVSREELERVTNQLKEDKNLTLRDLTDKIGAEYKNYLYKGFNMDKEVFDRLESLFGEEINHEIVSHSNGVSYEKRIMGVEKNEGLAEFVGMLLGDGNIQNFHEKRSGSHVTSYRVEMTLNENEEEIIERAKTLFESVAGRKPGVYSSKNSKAISLMVYSKDLVERLCEIGLSAGNKTKNQVGVPKWIKEKESFRLRCLKGLIDTDGCIYSRSHDDYKVIQFKNASRPLLDDFKSLCTKHDISVSKGGYRTVQVAAQEDVRRFIRLVKPIKARRLESQLNAAP